MGAAKILRTIFIPRSPLTSDSVFVCFQLATVPLLSDHRHRSCPSSGMPRTTQLFPVVCQTAHLVRYSIPHPTSFFRLHSRASPCNPAYSGKSHNQHLSLNSHRIFPILFYRLALSSAPQVFYCLHYLASIHKRQGCRIRKSGARSGEKYRSSLRKWDTDPCYDSFASWVSPFFYISFLLISFVFPLFISKKEGPITVSLLLLSYRSFFAPQAHS